MKVLSWLCLLAFMAQAQPTFYPFGINQDELSGAPDFSFLNRRIEAADRVFVRDGHFFRVGPDMEPFTPDDERVALFGMNLAFGANFPEERDSVRIAKRLRRLGVNLVRLHHMDSSPDSNPANAGSLLTTGPYPTLNPVAVQRLRVFMNALKEEGVYVNLNLKVGYTFRPNIDNVPPFSPYPTQSKPLHMVHSRLIGLQAEFTRKVLEALELRNDPVLAMVEINNETSLIYHWQTSSLERFLVSEYRDEFQSEWNGYLRRKYTSTEELKSAWGAGEPPGPELLPSRWVIENHTREPVSLQVDGDVARVQAPAATQPIMAKQIGFSVEEGRQYTAEVEIRADLPAGTTRNVYWDVKQDVSPWQSITGQTVAVGSEWKSFRMAVTPRFALNGTGRFALSIEAVGQPVYIRNWRLYTAEKRGLREGESLESGVPLLGDTENGTQAVVDDYLLFLADRDRAYLRALLDATRESTDKLVPVAGTQMGFGGLMNLDSHDDLDYQDNHFYVDHYSFPNTSWDGRDWRMRDQSAVGSGASSYQTMAVTRQAGRPYTVSEYNQPWPNTYAAECDPVLAVFGRFQDWDSIMHFAYSHGRGWDDGVPNGFNINGDWTKFPNVGQSAWLFRTNAIQVGKDPVTIPLTRDLRLRSTRERRNGSVAGFLTSMFGYDGNLAFVHPIRLAKDSEEPVPEAARTKVEGPFRSDTGEFTYDRDGRLFLIHSPFAAGVYGFLGTGRKLTAGAMDVELSDSSRGFAAILATPLDAKPIEESDRILISNPGHALRSQPGSDPPRPQGIVRYQTTTDWWTIEREPSFQNKPSGNLNGGVRPTWMERVEARITLRTSAQRMIAYPLDGSGQRMDPIEGEAVEGGISLHLRADSPWYEVVRVTPEN